MVNGKTEDGDVSGGNSKVVKTVPSDWTQHRVKSGESLDKIARVYEVSIADLKRWNNLRTSRIKAGDIIEIYDKPEEKGKIIASAPKLNEKNISHSVVKTSSKGLFASTHKVKRGETISLIAQQYGIDIKSLRKANGLRSNKIKVGQILKIPGKS
jgi:LysM repeat protein